MIRFVFLVMGLILRIFHLMNSEMTFSTQPNNLGGLIVIRMMHLRIYISTFLARSFNNLPSLEIYISVASTIIFFSLIFCKRVIFSMISHIFCMASKAICVCWSTRINSTFTTNFFSFHRSILS